MTKADREALRKRMVDKGWARVESFDNLLGLIVRESDRAVRRERARTVPTTVTGRWVDQKWIPAVVGRRKHGYWLMTVQTRKGKRA